MLAKIPDSCSIQRQGLKREAEPEIPEGASERYHLGNRDANPDQVLHPNTAGFGRRRRRGGRASLALVGRPQQDRRILRGGHRWTDRLIRSVAGDSTEAGHLGNTLYAAVELERLPPISKSHSSNHRR